MGTITLLKIFEIKIYPFSPEQFANKIQRAKDIFFENHTYATETRARDMYSFLYGTKISFEDYSVGYLDILYWGCCLHYEAKIMLRKKYPTSKEIQRCIDNMDDKQFPYQDMKEQEAIKRLGYTRVTYKPPLFTEKKHYMSNYHIDGLYTGISGRTNYEIAEIIKNDIKKIQDRDLFQGFYFDTSLFNTIGKYIDYWKIFEKSK